VVEIDVYDDAFQLCILTKGIGGANDDIVKVAIASTEICGGMMARWSNQCEGSGCLARHVVLGAWEI